MPVTCPLTVAAAAATASRFHAKTGYDASIRAWCRQQGVTYQSFWTLTANPDALKSAAVRAAARQRGCEPEQVCLMLITLYVWSGVIADAQKVGSSAGSSQAARLRA